MKQKGHSQSSLGTLIGCKYQTIGNYLNGKRMPDGDMIIDLAKALGVSSDYLLGLADNPTTDATAKAAQEYTGLSWEAVEQLHSLDINFFAFENDIKTAVAKHFISWILMQDEFKFAVTDIADAVGFEVLRSDFAKEVDDRTALPIRNLRENEGRLYRLSAAQEFVDAANRYAPPTELIQALITRYRTAIIPPRSSDEGEG
jgi:transcriptional regulator with XRE-family HTH domain